MDFFHGERVGDNQVIVAAEGAFAAKMFGGQVLALQVGAHGAIKDQNALLQCIQDNVG